MILRLNNTIVRDAGRNWQGAAVAAQDMAAVARPRWVWWAAYPRWGVTQTRHDASGR